MKIFIEIGRGFIMLWDGHRKRCARVSTKPYQQFNLAETGAEKMASVTSKKPGECILAIDAGTQSIRAVLIDLKGNLIDIVKTPIEPYFSAHPGWAEQ